MSTIPSTITLHMVTSLDGIIAKSDNSVSWFDTPDTYEKGIEGEDVAAFLKTIDCYVMGSRTYEHALALSKDYGWAYGDTPTYVMTQRQLPVMRSNVKLQAASLAPFVNDYLRPRYRNIWVAGGAQLSKEFIRLGLADDIRQTIIPIILGGGLPFLDQLGIETPLHLKNVSAYKNGMVELWYEIRK